MKNISIDTIKEIYMKRFLILIIGGVLFWGVSSCKKEFLNLTPLDSISDQNVWQNAELMRMFVNNMYNGIESGIALTCDNMNAPMAVMTDEARSAYVGSTANTTMITGSYSTSNAPLNNWAFQYSNIRNSNIFLDNVGVSPVAQADKDKLTGEVKYIRAQAYFELVKRFGGVPLITKTQQLSDDLLVPRNTLQQCYDFIEQDLNEAIPLLPGTNGAGLATRWAALALKSRVMVYAASYAQFGVMDPDGFGAIDPSQAQAYWQKAYDAAREVIESGPFDLVTNLDVLFIPKGGNPSVESIFEIQYAPPIRGHGFHYINGPNTESPDWTSCANPSQELVDAFPMKNGLPITDPASGYDPQDPYKNRDARLDVSVLRNGSPWRNIMTREATVIDTKPGGANQIVPPNFQFSITHTGYYVKKFIDPAVTIATHPYGQNYVNWVELRLGEVLLNYAEAAVELNRLQDAVDAIERLRDRAGTTTPFTVAAGADRLREIVREERKIELCFENHRLWDLRRWRKAEEVLHGLTVSGMWITDIGGGVLNYEIRPADVTTSAPRTFLPRHYLFPIPFSEMQQNTSLKQNPGW